MFVTRKMNIYTVLFTQQSQLISMSFSSPFHSFFHLLSHLTENGSVQFGGKKKSRNRQGEVKVVPLQLLYDL